jgi:hypothetical protein
MASKIVEYNEVSGSLNNVIETLNRKIGQYKANHTKIKIGITGRDPQQRFNEHLKTISWSRMVVIYETSSHNFANTIEKWLVEQHFDELVNQKQGGGSELSYEGKNYVYVLMK